VLQRAKALTLHVHGNIFLADMESVFDERKLETRIGNRKKQGLDASVSREALMHSIQ
jgi:hypothetical protein